MQQLIAHLQAKNVGVSNIDELTVRPGELDVERAAQIFDKYGFVYADMDLKGLRCVGPD